MASICMHLPIGRRHPLKVIITLHLSVLMAVATSIAQIPNLANSNFLHLCNLAISELYLVFPLFIYCTFQVF
jgi:hypothetical protein